MKKNDVILLRFLSVWLLIVAAMFVAIWTPSVSEAGNNCFANRSFYTAPAVNTYVAPTYVAPITKTYTPYVGTVNYGHNYYTPVVVEALVAPDYYYSVGSYYRDKVLADSIAAKVAEQLKRDGGGTQPGTQTPSPLPKTPLPNPMQGLPPEPQQGVSGPVFDYQEPKLQAVIEKSCARCHTDGKAAKGLVFVREGKLVPHSAETWNESFIQVSTGDMPQGGKPLEDSETVLFRLAALSVKTGQRVTLK